MHVLLKRNHQLIASILLLLTAIVFLASNTYPQAWDRRPYLPDSRRTPGVVQADFNNSNVPCQTPRIWTGFSKAVQYAILSSYHIPIGQADNYYIDNLIPLEIGGTNEMANLWPIPIHAQVTLQNQDKDLGYWTKYAALQAVLQAICDGRISPAEAREQFAENWTILYREFVSEEFPDYPEINNIPYWKKRIQ